MSDTKLTDLPLRSAPLLPDYVYIVDPTAGASGSYGITLDRFLGFAVRGTCQGRLTLATGNATPSNDVTGANTIYFTPYGGSLITVYDGTRWKLYGFTELSKSLTGLISGKNYDVFIYDSSGTLQLELGTAWTNDSTRAVALSTQDGILVKSTDTTRRYLGVFRATATTTTEDSKLNRLLCNAYNLVQKELYNFNATNHNYNVAAGNPWGSLATPLGVYWIQGQSQYVQMNIASTHRASVAGNFAGVYVLIDLNSGTADLEMGGYVDNRNMAYIGATVGGGKMLTAGYHYAQAMEYSNTTASNNFDRALLTGTIWA